MILLNYGVLSSLQLFMLFKRVHQPMRILCSCLFLCNFAKSITCGEQFCSDLVESPFFSLLCLTAHLSFHHNDQFNPIQVIHTLEFKQMQFTRPLHIRRHSPISLCDFWFVLSLQPLRLLHFND